MQQLNFLVENIGASQLGYYLTTELNKIHGHKDVDSIVFYNTLHKHALQPNFAIMQMMEAWCQPGTTIATSLTTASQLLSFPGPKHRIYYVWDLPWMRIVPKTYSVAANIITQDKLTLVARSMQHALAIENAFNIAVKYIVEDFNMELFIQTILEIQND